MNVRRARGPHNRSVQAHKRAACHLTALLVIGCCVSSGGAQWLETKTQPAASRLPQFDTEDVRQHVRASRSLNRPSDPSTLSLDDGEFVVDTSATIVPAYSKQDLSATAFDGTNFLVVWEDRRSAIEFDIYGTRVTPQGTVLDPAGIIISQPPNGGGAPAVSFDGANFLVVWSDSRSDDGDIYGARVTPQGTVLDPAGFVVVQAANDQSSPSVDFDGASFLVVWDDYRSGSDHDIYGARVTTAGVVLDSSGFVISQAASDQGSPYLVFDGATFLVVWGDRRSGSPDIYGARVTPQGAVLDPSGFVISQSAGSQSLPSLGFDGKNFLVAWCSGDIYYRDIYAARVTQQGTVLDPEGIVIVQAADDQTCPSVDFDGVNFFVAWGDYRSGWEHIYGARVTPAGLVLDPSGFIISQWAGGQGRPAVAFDGTNSLVTWDEWHTYGGFSDIYGARVTPQGMVLDSAGIALSTAATWQGSPALAFDGADFLVAWQDRRSEYDWDIRGARVTQQGAVLDSAGIGISTAANWQQSPALAFDRANFLVAWRDDRIDSSGDIYGARVTPAGLVLDPSGFVISQAANGQHWPAVGFDDANYLVVWEDHRSGSDDIYGTRVTPAGVVLDPSGLVISQAGADQRSPAVGFDGANFLVAWHDYRNDINIYGARVTSAGVVLDPSGFAISRAAGEQYYPALAFDGANFLAVWEDNRNGYWDVYGARVTTQGTVLDSAGIAISLTTSGTCYPPAVDFDGASFLVVGEYGRFGGDWDIYGARVTPAGMVFDGGPVVRQQGHQWYPRLCCGSGTQMLLVYQGWTSTVDGTGYNTYRIWGKMNPNPGVAETPSDEVRTTNSKPTIVRGVLFLSAASSSKLSAASLLDVGGRRMTDLHPGANDVRALAPGVYFVREVRAEARSQAVRKVIITR